MKESKKHKVGTITSPEKGQRAKLNIINQPKTFTIMFGSDTKKILHIPMEDLLKVADILNEFLNSKGIASYIQEFPDEKKNSNQ